MEWGGEEEGEGGGHHHRVHTPTTALRPDVVNQCLELAPGLVFAVNLDTGSNLMWSGGGEEGERGKTPPPSLVFAVGLGTGEN